MKRLLFRLAVLLALAFAAWAVIPVVEPAFRRAHFLYTLAREGPPQALPMPVAPRGPLARLTDTWGAPRSGGRRHEGIDIFAPKGTPVVSTTRGVVTRVGTNRLGGQVVGVLGPALEFHYYAHLDRFGDFREGDLVQPGDVLGFVGNTGNARGTPPHLHYGIYRQGALNPYPRLTAALPGAADSD